MNKPQAYAVKTTDDRLIFQFNSVSVEKRIKKVVLYQKYSDFAFLISLQEQIKFYENIEQSSKIASS